MAINDANQQDFLGEGTAPTPQAPPLDPAELERRRLAAERARLQAQATNTANININSDRTKGYGAPLGGNTQGGATGAYLAGNDSGRAQFDYMHELGSTGFLQTPRTLLNNLGERVGVSHVGDVANPAALNIDFGRTPIDAGKGLVNGAVDPNTGLGTTVGGTGGATGGKPVTNLSPGTRNAAGFLQGFNPSISDAAAGPTACR